MEGQFIQDELRAALAPFIEKDVSVFCWALPDSGGPNWVIQMQIGPFRVLDSLRVSRDLSDAEVVDEAMRAAWSDLVRLLRMLNAQPIADRFVPSCDVHPFMPVIEVTP
ncbi:MULTISPECIES: hypothetical protein [unclassified Ruegeria]|uniref:hypothetical protein n=1 Tax=unclassified Ruegeria TaxID=2625375 RepID=UPI001492F885|nr:MULTISPECIES: hypothetical protein [unclassified Ruegeria]NOD87890.1 hypothetical protein [Ruegeria sp. HKCCD4318]NOE14260.1 hypothetical protein [Ruegeria sp. HKCCD4318-2]NOG08383.1 hypothetical protein [Ruegeria sp. HKCCD4315]